MNNPVFSRKAAIAIASALIVVALISRLAPHPPNVAPITAIALFGATMLPRRTSVILPLIAMIISDALIGWHNVIAWTWGSFALIAVLGLVYLRGKVTMWRLATLTISSSVIFFIVSNFGVWLQSGLYPRTTSGLVDTYVMALPFFRNTLLGDVFYTAVIFSLFALAVRLAGMFKRAVTARQV